MWKEVVVNSIFLEILRKNTEDFSYFQLLDMDHES
jgi:hypothetical protein